jgi:hypothetical protein
LGKSFCDLKQKKNKDKDKDKLNNKRQVVRADMTLKK